MSKYFNLLNHDWTLQDSGKVYRITIGLNENLPDELEKKFKGMLRLISIEPKEEVVQPAIWEITSKNETEQIFNRLIKKVDNKRLGQQPQEWREFIRFVSSYFRTRGIEHPIVVEIGVWYNAQQIFYEEILGAEYIGIDISNKFCTIKGDTHQTSTLEQLKKILNGRKIDLLFIDGDHSYNGVKKDYEMYSPLVEHIIAFHDITTIYDTNPKDPVHVVEFWNELEVSDKENTHITIFHHNPKTPGIFAPGRQMGIGVVVKLNGKIVEKKVQKDGMKVYTFAVCRNEEKMLPYYLKHYEKIADRIIICDGGSTDGSLVIMKANSKVVIVSDPQEKQDEYNLMKFRNEYYLKHKNEIDWAIIGDIDEFLMVDRETLLRYKNEKINIPKVVGYQMFSEDFPSDKSKQIYEQVHTGFSDPKWMNKNVIFNPKEVVINYVMGCHKCNPQGDIKYSNNYLNLLHFKCIGYDQFIDKSKKSSERLSERSIQKGLAFQYKVHSKLTKEEFKRILVHGKVFDKPNNDVEDLVTFDNSGKVISIEKKVRKEISETDLVRNYKKQWDDISEKTVNNKTIVISNRPKEYKVKSNLKVNCVIPTLGLREQITDTIDTLLTSTYKNIQVIIIVQEKKEMVDKLKTLYMDDNRVEVIFEKERIGWVQSLNNIAKREGHLFALADDIAITREVIEILISEMDRLFSNSDGVLLTNLTFTLYKDKMGWAGSFPLIGNKFISRFPGRQVICPDYMTYCGDVELPDFANSIKKCLMIPEARVIHFERRTIKKEATAILTRQTGIPDMETYFIRQQRGYLWGKNFNLLKDERR
jgi:glycosyltransferase involved in cell wall biosynthesis